MLHQKLASQSFNVSCQTLQRKRNYIKLISAGNYHRNRDDFLDQNEDKQILTQDIPVGRFGLVEEVAEVVYLFLRPTHLATLQDKQLMLMVDAKDVEVFIENKNHYI